MGSAFDTTAAGTGRRQPKTAVSAVLCCWLLLLWSVNGWAEGHSRGTAAAVPIQVEITTHLGDGHSFSKGDSIAFFLSLDQDAHIVAVYEDAHQQLIQIVPNANQQDDFYPSGLFSPIPGKNAGFRFTVAPPFGQERLWVFASRAPIATLAGERLSNGLKRLAADIPAIQDQIRAGAGAAYGEYCLPLQTLGGD